MELRTGKELSRYPLCGGCGLVLVNYFTSGSKYLTRSNLRKERFILLKGFLPSWQESLVAAAEGPASHIVCSVEEDTDECCW